MHSTQERIKLCYYKETCFIKITLIMVWPVAETLLQQILSLLGAQQALAPCQHDSCQKWILPDSGELSLDFSTKVANPICRDRVSYTNILHNLNSCFSTVDTISVILVRKALFLKEFGNMDLQTDQNNLLSQFSVLFNSIFLELWGATENTKSTNYPCFHGP